MRQLILVLVVLLAGSTWLAGASASPDDAQRTDSTAQLAALHYLGQQAAHFQRATWHWQRVMGLPFAKTHGRVMSELSIPDAKAAVALWQRRAMAVRQRAQHPPHLRDWLCIHRYEASWYDRGAPYYGGLQMDLGFQRHYGFPLLHAKGTADHWTPLEQIWVAEKARRSGRGFYPWPNTARYCGLL